MQVIASKLHPPIKGQLVSALAVQVGNLHQQAANIRASQRTRVTCQYREMTVPFTARATVAVNKSNLQQQQQPLERLSTLGSHVCKGRVSVSESQTDWVA